MVNKILKERTIFDNYDLSGLYPDADLIEMARDNGWIEEDEIPCDNTLWDWRYEKSSLDWEIAKDEIDNFFKDADYIGFFGEIGRWDGIYKGGSIGSDFWELFNKAIKDCDYVKLYDENGHLYLTCSHHDGTCHFEIKIITEKGYNYLQNWEYDGDDKRTKEYVYNQIYKRYSKLPHYANKVYGLPKMEYEPITKDGLVNKLNNQAKSNY